MHLLVRSLATGELFARKILYNPGKIPLPAENVKEIPPPPGYSQIPVREGYRSGDLWSELKKSVNFPLEEGRLAITILCGNYLSNTVYVEIENSGVEPKNSPYIRQIPRSHAQFRKEDFQKTEFTPEIPEQFGIRFNPPVIQSKLPKKKISAENKDFIFRGSFKLKTNIELTEAKRITIRIIGTEKESGEIIVQEVPIPETFITISGSTATGYFSFDLLDLFRMPNQKYPILPDELYLTAVYGDIITEPVKFGFSSLSASP